MGSTLDSQGLRRDSWQTFFVGNFLPSSAPDGLPSLFEYTSTCIYIYIHIQLQPILWLVGPYHGLRLLYRDRYFKATTVSIVFVSERPGSSGLRL